MIETTATFSEAAEWWVASHRRTVREHLYAYRGVLGSLRDTEQVETFTATDGYALWTCTVRLVSMESCRFTFTAIEQVSE